MKRLSILCLTYIFLFMSIVGAYANSEMSSQNLNEKFKESSFDAGEFRVNILESSDTYEKLEMIDNKTGKVEYIESFLDNAQSKYVITNNINNDKMVFTETNENFLIFENNVLVEEIAKKTVLKDNVVAGWSAWTGWSYWNTTRSIKTGNVAAIASLLAIAFGGWAVSVFIVGAERIVAYNLKDVWLKKGLRQRYDLPHSIQRHEKSFIYSNSSRTNLIDTKERYYYVPVD